MEIYLLCISISGVFSLFDSLSCTCSSGFELGCRLFAGLSLLRIDCILVILGYGVLTLGCPVQVLEELAQREWAHESVYYLCLVKIVNLLSHILFLRFIFNLLLIGFFPFLIHLMLLIIWFNKLFDLLCLNFLFFNNLRLQQDMKVLLFGSAH